MMRLLHVERQLRLLLARSALAPLIGEPCALPCPLRWAASPSVLAVAASHVRDCQKGERSELFGNGATEMDWLNYDCGSSNLPLDPFLFCGETYVFIFDPYRM